VRLSDLVNYWRTGLSIGSDSWGAFNGTIDEVRIYSRVLSAAEIQALAAQ